MKKIRYILISFVITVLLSACSSEAPYEKKIAAFSYTDQNGQPFGAAQLAGKIWVADFIFTKCESVCPPMTSEMTLLQKKFKDEGIQAEFISFTVDPTVDSPEVLKDYIHQYTDNESNWHLLTDYTQEEIEVFAREQFQTIVQKPSTSNQVIHGTNFYLINQQGFLVNEYNLANNSYAEELVRDIKKIQK